MKLEARLTITILALCVLVCNQNAYSQRTKKPVNISINANSSVGDSLKCAHLNLGLMSNIYEMKGLGINILSGVVSTNAYGLQTAGIANITGQEMKGIQLSGITNINGGKSAGIVASGLVNLTGKSHTGLLATGGINIVGEGFGGISVGGLMNVMSENSSGLAVAGIVNLMGENANGMAISGLLNVNANHFTGVQANGLMNVVGERLVGVQTAGLCNVAVQAKGAQMAGVSNIVTDSMSGVQLSGVTNIAMELDKGVQIALANIALKEMKGVQMGVGNYSTNVKGVQIGLLNICAGKLKGIQIGLVNHSKDTTVWKAGLVNVNPTTRIRMMAYGGNTTRTNLAIRFQNRYTYTILGVGTHYLGLNEEFSGALFYRAGLHKQLFNRCTLSGDLGFYHIENFENESVAVPERMYSLQARINFEYNPIKKLGVFASGGYGVTRHYDKNKMFEKKPIVELGIILF